MSLTTVLAMIAVILYGAAQYALMVQALRDLMRRPRVRGNNKVVWAIVILTLPIFGAIIYNWTGPTSFVRRAPGPAQVGRASVNGASRTLPTAAELNRAAKITPITAHRGVTVRGPRPVRRPAGSHIRDTGS